MKKLFLIQVFMIASVVTTWAQLKVSDAANADNPAKIKVACMGNSITAGNYNYPTPLGALLGDDYDVRTFGKGGSGVFIDDRFNFDGNNNGIYVRTQEYAAALAFNPDIVTIKLGTNDVGEFFLCEKNFWYTDCGQKILREGVQERFKNDYMTLIGQVQALPFESSDHSLLSGSLVSERNVWARLCHGRSYSHGNASHY